MNNTEFDKICKNLADLVKDDAKYDEYQNPLRRIKNHTKYGERQKKEVFVSYLFGKTPQGVEISYEEIINIYKFLKSITQQPEDLYNPKFFQHSCEKLKDIWKILKRHKVYNPKVLRHIDIGCSAEKIEETIEYLEKRSINSTRVINKYSQVFNYPVEKIEKSIQVLKENNIKNIKKVVEKFPSLLGLSPETLREKLEYFEKIVNKDLGKIIELNPYMLGLSNSTIETKINNLESQGFDVKKLVKKYPAILNYNIESLNEKINYLKESGYSIEEIENFPACLGRSLNLIKERIDYLKSKGKHLILDRVFRSSDDYFYEKY